MNALVIADMSDIAPARKPPKKKITKKDVDNFVRWFENARARGKEYEDATDWLGGAKEKLAGRRRGVTPPEEWLSIGINAAAYRIYGAIDDAFQGLFLRNKNPKDAMKIYRRFHSAALMPLEGIRGGLTDLLGHSKRFENDDDVFAPADFLVRGSAGKSIFDTYIGQGADGMRALLQGYLFAGPAKFSELYSLIDGGARSRLKEFAETETDREYLSSHRRKLITFCEERLAKTK